MNKIIVQLKPGKVLRKINAMETRLQVLVSEGAPDADLEDLRSRLQALTSADHDVQATLPTFRATTRELSYSAQEYQRDYAGLRVACAIIGATCAGLKLGEYTDTCKPLVYGAQVYDRLISAGYDDDMEIFRCASRVLNELLIPALAPSQEEIEQARDFS